MSKKRVYEFLQLTNTMPYPPTKKADLSIVHSKLIEQVVESFDNTRSTKERIIHIFNCVTYMYVSGDALPKTWNVNDPLHTYTDFSDDFLEANLNNCFLHQKDVDWVDVPIIQSGSNLDSKPIQNVTPKTVPQSSPLSIEDVGLSSTPIKHTHKSDLYIQPPTVPRFDTSTAFASGSIDGTPFVVYMSYPEIPTKQNEISVTTDVNKMTDLDLMKLFPTELVRTRAESMYNECDGIELDSKLGLIIPIEGFTKKQIRDNIVKYPHLFKLFKIVNDVPESFYTTIEIDGELHKISEIWERLPISKHAPYTKEFVKEYVVRRYLLERDVKKIEHRYKMYGSLDPFLTLFTTADDYIHMGYHDPVNIARECVKSRVSYKQSRNPVLRRLQDV